MRCRFLWVMGLGVAALTLPSRAEIRLFAINADGFKEVNASGVSNGDPDGRAIGTISVDNVAGSATLNLTISNITGSLLAHHFHEGPPTTTGPVRIDFGNPNTILTGTPTAGTLSGTVTGLPIAQINNLFANPNGFYYNLHTTPDFPGGAVRDQLPEPGLLSVIGLGGIMFLRRGRR